MPYPTPWPHGQQQSGPPMLASHAERERTVDVLKAGFAEGRLFEPELEQRVARAQQARTVNELVELVADLPQGPAGALALALVPAPAPVSQTFGPPPKPPINGKAAASLALGVLTVPTLTLTGLPALLLSYSARAEIRRTGERGDGMALGGQVLGWVAVTCLAVVLTIAVIASLV